MRDRRGHGSMSRAQKCLLPSYKLLGVVDRPQEGRGRFEMGAVLSFISSLPLIFLVGSEERCWGDNPLQIFLRHRVYYGDAEFVGDKPVCLLQMVRTVTQD